MSKLSPSKALAVSPQRRNHQVAKSAKVTIRLNLMNAVTGGGMGAADVFDAYAGGGEMWASVWRQAASYVGCDKEWPRDDRLIYVADNVRVLRCLDLAAFNIFDLDAYGSPWEQAMIVAARRKVAPGEMIAIAMTDGCGLLMKLQSLPRALAVLTGMTKHPAGLIRARGAILDKALANLAASMKCEIVKRWQAKSTRGSAVVYLGVVLRGLAVKPPRRRARPRRKPAEGLAP